MTPMHVKSRQPLSDPAACVHVFGWMDVWTGLDKTVKAWLKK